MLMPCPLLFHTKICQFTLFKALVNSTAGLQILELKVEINSKQWYAGDVDLASFAAFFKNN